MKRLGSIICILTLICYLMLPIFKPAEAAETLNILQVGAMAFSLFKSWGVDLQAVSGTVAGMENWMSSEIEDYLSTSDHTLFEAFGSDQMRILAGKMVVGQQFYNGLVDFWNYFNNKFGITAAAKNIFGGTIGGIPIAGENIGTTTTPIGTGVMFANEKWISTPVGDKQGYAEAYAYSNDYQVANYFPGSGRIVTGKWRISLSGSLYSIDVQVWRNIHDSPYWFGIYTYPQGTIPKDRINASLTADYQQPEVIDESQIWQGIYGGQDLPEDTDVDTLVDDIYGQVAADTLDVDGEVTDPIVPPAPTVAPDTPLADAPYSGLTDAIGTGADTITGSITSTAEGTQEAIGEAAEAITGAIDAVTDVPAPADLPSFTFDLRDYFPFCIPFDIARMLAAFDGAAAAPDVTIPFNIPSIGLSYNVEIDLSVFDPVAAVLRQAELIAFAITLAWATSKVIRW